MTQNLLWQVSGNIWNWQVSQHEWPVYRTSFFTIIHPSPFSLPTLGLFAWPHTSHNKHNADPTNSLEISHAMVQSRGFVLENLIIPDIQKNSGIGSIPPGIRAVVSLNNSAIAHDAKFARTTNFWNFGGNVGSFWALLGPSLRRPDLGQLRTRAPSTRLCFLDTASIIPDCTWHRKYTKPELSQE